MDVYNLVSLAGLFALMAIAWLCSANRRNLNFRCIAAGTPIQLIQGTAVLLEYHAGHHPGICLGFHTAEADHRCRDPVRRRQYFCRHRGRGRGTALPGKEDAIRIPHHSDGGHGSGGLLDGRHGSIDNQSGT